MNKDQLAEHWASLFNMKMLNDRLNPVWIRERHAFIAGWDARNDEVARLRQVLLHCECAILALETTQKEEGLGLIGKSFVAPAAIARIHEALSEAPQGDE